MRWNDIILRCKIKKLQKKKKKKKKLHTKIDCKKHHYINNTIDL